MPDQRTQTRGSFVLVESLNVVAPTCIHQAWSRASALVNIRMLVALLVALAGTLKLM